MKTRFHENSLLTSAWFKAMQDIKFDGLDEDGHYPPIDISGVDFSGTQIGADIAALQTNYTALNSSYTNLNGRATTLETTATSYGTRLTAIETTNTSQQSSITTLTSNYTTLTNTSNTQTTQISGLTTRVTALEAGGSLGALETRVTTAESNISALQTSATTATNTNNTQTTQISGLDTRVTALETNPPSGADATVVAKMLSLYGKIKVNGVAAYQDLSITGNPNGYMNFGLKPFQMIRRQWIDNDANSNSYYRFLLSGAIFNLNTANTDATTRRLLTADNSGIATSNPAYNVYGGYCVRLVIPWLDIIVEKAWLQGKLNTKVKIYLRVEDDAVNRNALGSTYSNASSTNYFDANPIIYGATTDTTKAAYYCYSLGVRVSTVATTNDTLYPHARTDYGFLGWDTGDIPNSGTTFIGVLELTTTSLTSFVSSPGATNFWPYWDTANLSPYTVNSGINTNIGGTYAYQQSQLTTNFNP